MKSGFTRSVVTYTTTETETVKDGERIILCNNTSNITIYLPTAVGNIARFEIKKINSASATVTINGYSSETIDGGLTATLQFQNESISLVSDNSNWLII